MTTPSKHDEELGASLETSSTQLECDTLDSLWSVMDDSASLLVDGGTRQTLDDVGEDEGEADGGAEEEDRSCAAGNPSLGSLSSTDTTTSAGEHPERQYGHDVVEIGLGNNKTFLHYIRGQHPGAELRTLFSALRWYQSETMYTYLGVDLADYLIDDLRVQFPNLPSSFAFEHAAISNEDKDSVECYYVSRSDALKYADIAQVSDYLVNMGSTGQINPYVRKEWCHFMTKHTAKQLSYPTLCKLHNITSTRILKIDAEGDEPVIIQSVIDACAANSRLWPWIIQIETNGMADAKFGCGAEEDMLISLQHRGYRIAVGSFRHNSVLVWDWADGGMWAHSVNPTKYGGEGDYLAWFEDVVLGCKCHCCGFQCRSRGAGRHQWSRAAEEDSCWYCLACWRNYYNLLDAGRDAVAVAQQRERSDRQAPNDGDESDREDEDEVVDSPWWATWSDDEWERWTEEKKLTQQAPWTEDQWEQWAAEKRTKEGVWSAEEWEHLAEENLARQAPLTEEQWEQWAAEKRKNEDVRSAEDWEQWVEEVPWTYEQWEQWREERRRKEGIWSVEEWKRVVGDAKREEALWTGERWARWKADHPIIEAPWTDEDWEHWMANKGDVVWTDEEWERWRAEWRGGAVWTDEEWERWKAERRGGVVWTDEEWERWKPDHPRREASWSDEEWERWKADHPRREASWTDEEWERWKADHPRRESSSWTNEERERRPMDATTGEKRRLGFLSP